MPEQSYIKLIILCVTYILLFTLEQLQPYFLNRRYRTRHSARNLSLALINATISSLFLIYVLSHTFTWTTENNLGLLNHINVSAAVSFLFALLLIDCWQYIWHRANHVLPLLWKFHQVHHSDKEMDASTALRFHPIEILYSNAIRIAIIPIAGIQLEHLILYEIILLPVILFHHSNIKLNETIDRALRTIIVTPHMHRLHHSDIQTETDSNYSNIFSIWDRLFNSYTMRPIEERFHLGLGEKFSESEWNHFGKILTIPFIRK